MVKLLSLVAENEALFNTSVHEPSDNPAQLSAFEMVRSDQDRLMRTKDSPASDFVRLQECLRRVLPTR